MPDATGSIGLRCIGGLVAATHSGFVFVDTSSGDLTPIVQPEAHIPGNRFNDGKVNRVRRFWAGTKNLANDTRPTGSVYRLDSDGSPHLVIGGVTCSNGIAWSPDNRTMYLCDTWMRRIYSFEFDLAVGTVHNRRLFDELEVGFPDGVTVDAEGFV